MPATKRRPFRWWLWAPVALLLIVVILWVFVVVHSRLCLSDAIDELKTAGFATRFADLQSASFPADTDATPLWQAAIALYVPFPSEQDDLSTKVAVEGFDTLSSAEMQVMAQWLDQNRPCLDAIRRARALPHCNFPRKPYHGYILGTQPHYESCNTLRRALRIRAAWQIHSGRHADVRETVRDMLGVAEVFADDPMLVAQLFREGHVRYALSLASDAINAGTTEQDMDAWLDVLPPPERYKDMTALGLRGEIAVDAEVFANGDFDLVTQVPYGWTPHPGIAWLVRPFERYDAARILQLLPHLVELSRMPYPEAKPRLDALESDLGALPVPLAPLSNLLKTAPSSVLRQGTRLQAALAVMRAGLECELHHARHGRYPDGITALDPFTEHPLIYRTDLGLLYADDPDIERKPDGSPTDDAQIITLWRLRHFKAPEGAVEGKKERR